MVSNIIIKYKIKFGDTTKYLILIYNAMKCNHSDTLKEAGLMEDSNIFVLEYRPLLGL